jgi:predicted acetyltransferase
LTAPEPIGADEAEAFVAAAEEAFHAELTPEEKALELSLLEPERTLALRDEGGRIVATAAAYSRRLTVPGGASVPVAGVTLVGVVPGHTRRGHMRRLMKRQLSDLHATGEPPACLWSSEAGIYTRFGYGPGTQSVSVTVRLPVPLRATPPVRARLAEPDPAVLAPIYDAARRPGMLHRDTRWWARRVYDPEHRRDGAGKLRCALVEGAGYALYAVKGGWGEHGPQAEVRLRELVAVTPEARAALWRHLLELDLARSLKARLAPAGDPLPHLLARPDALVERYEDGLWIRLVDVRAALAARAYAMPFSLALEVEDAVCPWNAGVHRLAFDGSAATCEPAEGGAELAVTAEALGAAYLGGTSLALLAEAGMVRELRPGALHTAAVAFREPLEPWCPEVF